MPARRRYEGDHSAGNAHLVPCQFGLRMGMAALRQAGIADQLDVVTLRQHARDGHRVLCVPLGPERERPEAAQDEEAVERAGYGAHRVLQETESFGELGTARGHHSIDRVGMAGQVFGRGMEGDVGAELDRPLDGRRGEGVVDDNDRMLTSGARRLPSGLRNAGDVDEFQPGVGGRFEPDESRALRKGLSASREVMSTKRMRTPRGRRTLSK